MLVKVFLLIILVYSLSKNHALNPNHGFATDIKELPTKQLLYHTFLQIISADFFLGFALYFKNI
jgi:hypothetical protein